MSSGIWKKCCLQTRWCCEIWCEVLRCNRSSEAKCYVYESATAVACASSERSSAGSHNGGQADECSDQTI
ncbi:hypothetical protein Bhyg_12263 [Pseudolycoriella hygida]|uniref:Uncharacterized protein n=1 Tax=Pseudolycoriella hygida TaxID=35572 RepID=A0A9Q0MWX7_9DIPT|nr:hypothetical protein Bhyg_12263 [Pseudolycoriella hygida]